MKGPCCLALALLSAFPALGETVQVRSGEHPTFSRLVLKLAEPADWTLGRTANGYELRISRPDLGFGLERVFDLIPRARIVDVASPASGKLALEVAPGTYASAFEISRGTIVLDVVTGTAPAGSKFELPFPAEPEPAAQAAAASAPVLLPRPNAGNIAADPLLRYYWAGAPAETAPAAAITPAEADPRIRAAEEQLLAQLGLAASQGIVTMTLPDAPQAQVAAPEPAATAPASNDASHEARLALRSETVFDRDQPGEAPAALNRDGITCLPDALVDVAAWVSDAPAALQIGAARAGLLGEFDRPSPEAVLALARLYVALGLGAEVAALFDGLRVELPDGDVLRAMASVVDDRPVPPAARIASMADCDAQVALWGILAVSGLKRGDPVNIEAVLRGFSRLPLPLRLLLGPRLADRLLAIGAEPAARNMRDAITRAPGDHAAAIGMIDAGIEMARGEAAAAAETLAPLVAADGSDAPRAMVLLVDSLLAAGAGIDLATIDAVAALAHEHRNAPDGAALARAHVLAAGSAGLFARAFDALAQIRGATSGDLVASTAADLVRQLADTPEDAVFAAQYFRNRPLVLKQQDWPLQLRTAERLLELGFAAEARRVLGPEAVRHESGRLLRARAAVQQGEGAAALAEIAGLTGAEAARLRADALRLSGDHDAARRAYSLAAAPAEAGAEAWRAGDWQTAAEIATPAQRALLAAFGLAAATEPAGAPGTLAAARQLLAQSQTARAALAAALDETAR